ncbi:MAG: tRNA (adenosine(37)-N6)-threonylcarbamoyltransferase complex ATPase subunit type 1 TsaE [Pseudomonadota bacterium]
MALGEIVHETNSEAETRKLGADISLTLKQGDMIALSGELGAGKSAFARGLIAHLLQDKTQEIASPTYTLCNVYQTEPAIAHFDLYRLSDPQELDELGLDEALETGCAIVEWPEKAFETMPLNAVHVEITELGETARKFRMSGNADLLGRIGRSIKIRDLLVSSGFGNAARSPLDGDASSRRYETLFVEGKPELLVMDAPETPDGPPVKDGKPYSKIAHLAENVSAFVAIDQVLRSKGFVAPNIPAMDMEAGILVVENLGSGKIIDEARQPIEERYQASAEFLADLHAHAFERQISLPDGISYTIPEYDHDALMIEVELLLEWYIQAFAREALKPEQRDGFFQIWTTLFRYLDSQQKTLVLRDFHSPNIIWRDQQTGTGRIGVIDFQDAVMGPCAYDVASLAQDARIDVSEMLETSLCEKYIAIRTQNDAKFDAEGFNESYAIMAAQRATKILGIFCRLNERDDKPQYLAHIPRMRDYLKRSLKHPVLGEYSNWLKTVIDL